MILFALLVTIVTSSPISSTEDLSTAEVEFVEANGSGVSGSVILRQSGNGDVKIYGSISGLKEGLHGFHVHEYGSLTNDCADTGGHFSPFDLPYVAPTDEDRADVGDLGNIETDENGRTVVLISDSLISLQDDSPFNIIGRSLVIHEVDELDSSIRVACGIIKLRQ